ncbi:MAG: ATP-binding cassette domain-containing protein, partial [Marmoricola sp.]
MPVPVLEVRGLAHAYPDGHQALFGVDLHVHQGERVALLGPNGAGKTTLVLHLNGILTAGAGSVSVSGMPVEKANLKEIRRRVGIVFQDPDDQLFMATVRQDVAFGPANQGLRGEELDARVLAALEQVGMAEYADRPPHHLSFGQRRRVAVATVLVMEPEILVLDVRGLAHAYPDGHQALFGVDLHVHQGERVALLGPNGAGKTTLVLHLNGILTAGAGSVSVSGMPVEKANL